MTNKIDLKEFAPAIRFLVVFLSIYLVGNVLYGLYVEFYKPRPDPATVEVTRQVAALLTLVDEPAGSKVEDFSPYVKLTRDNQMVLRIFEGCNGLNVIVIFFAFVAAFGGKAKHMIPFLALGVITIHLANLARILLLYYTALHRPAMFYYFHKYFFTAGLYLVVFVLWIFWMRSRIKESATAKT